MSDGTALESMVVPPAPASAPAPAVVTAPAMPAPAKAPPGPKPSTAGQPSAAGSSSQSAWHTLWLTDRDVAVFTGLAVIVLVLLIVRWAQLSGWGMHEIEIERLAPLEHSYRIDINSASWVELSQLDGIGESLALRIVEDRETNGPFRSVEDLDRVKGIGTKTLDRLRPYLRVDSMEEKPL